MSKGIQKVDMQIIRAGLPLHAVVTLLNKVRSGISNPYFDIKMIPAIDEEGYDRAKFLLKETIGKDNIREIVDIEKCSHMQVYMKGVQVNLINCTETDVMTFKGVIKPE